MLEDLSIKDFAIIDSVSAEFSNGFTVFSGETGAGKSILIGALSFLLGGKAEVSQIRNGCSEASVSGTFYLNPDIVSEEAFQWLEDHGIEPENQRILLRRFIRDNGKSMSYVGGVPVTRGDLQEFSAYLVDIHGQHEHQSLMKVSEHRKFLDARAGIVEDVKKFGQLFASLVEKRKQLDSLNTSESERKNKIEMLSFAVNEISEAKLKEGEDESLEAEESRLTGFEKLYSDVQEVTSSLDSGENSIVPALKKVLRDVQHASSLDKSLENLKGRLESVFYEVSDLSSEFSDYERKLVFDPQHLQEVQDRLSLIYNLKKKYADNINAPLKQVIDYCENARKTLDELSNSDQTTQELKEQISRLEKEVYVQAKNLSVKRKATGDKLASEIQTILGDLGMKGARFSVNILDKPGTDIEQKCGPYGMDNIEFLISANEGSAFLPLAKIASGGELSRVMLALKTIFAQNDSVETLIFDEIDTGIGGEVAVQVAKHIKKLASSHQIFCITHLASIAVFADNQIKIEKGVVSGKTSSHLREVSGEERVSEIARMLSGDSDNQASLEHARSMLEKCSITV